MEKSIRMTFDSPNEVVCLRFITVNSDISNRWFESLSYLVKKNFFLEKHFMFHGWRASLDCLANRIQELFFTMESLGRLHPLPLLVFKRLGHKTCLTQADLNLIHTVFEELIGQVGRPADFFIRANTAVQYLVLRINWLTHLIEASRRYQTKAESQREIVASFSEAPRGLLMSNHLASFSAEHECGNVYLKYCQLGKSPWEVFLDQDQYIGKNNISQQNYYSGEFVINFSNANPSSEKPLDYIQYLKDQNLSHQSPIGRCLVAQLEPDLCSSKGMIIDKLEKCQNLSKIELLRNQRVECENVFNYSPGDQNYEQRQIHFSQSSLISKLRKLGLSGVCDRPLAKTSLKIAVF